MLRGNKKAASFYTCLSIILFFFLGLCLNHFLFVQFSKNVLADTIPTSIRVAITLCGNGIKENDEQCDGNDFGGVTCRDLGYSGGTLRCYSNCTYNTSYCNTGGGGGGGGSAPGVSVLPPQPTTIIFKGLAYPQSKVFLLKDGQLAAMIPAGADAQFEIALTDISSGSYVFLIYSEDYIGRRSPPLSLPVTVTSNIITTISGIFLAPTIDLDKIQVKKGDNLVVFGQSAADAEVIISVNSETEKFFRTVADKKGAYLYNLDTSFLEFGQHLVKSKTSLNDLISSYGKTVVFEVGLRNILKEIKKEGRGDFNQDGRVNLIDFSLMAYWYKKINPPSGFDLNGDGVVNIIDFSILAYYWTG